MIDLIIRSTTKADLLNFATTHNLATMVDGELVLRKGFKFCWWGGNGKMLTKLGTYDDEGVELTAPVYATGVVAIMRFDHRFFFNKTKMVDGEQVTYKEYDAIEVDPEADNSEQHTRSRIAAYIKNNGTSGITGTINHWELGTAKLYRFEDVYTFLESRGIKGHTWSGGNWA